jgi:hypothetical protein
LDQPVKLDTSLRASDWQLNVEIGSRQASESKLIFMTERELPVIARDCTGPHERSPEKLDSWHECGVVVKEWTVGLKESDSTTSKGGWFFSADREGNRQLNLRRR